MKKVKVFFYIKSYFRERQWDTVKNVPENIEAITMEEEKPLGSLSIKKRHAGFLAKVKNFIAKNFLTVNFKIVPSIQRQADFIYTWGYYLLNPKKPFIVELDNPYALTLYNFKSFQKHKVFLKNYLRKAHKIIFMSEACQANFLEEMGEDFREKGVTLYPFMKRNYIKKEKRETDKNINFLFVSLSFKNKGGAELLEAFSQNEGDNLKLYFICDTPDDIKGKYKIDERIIFISPLPRGELIEKIYPKMDVFVFPTFYESFGLVVLEALSFGMGIIATNVYAIGEMVRNGENGALLNHPIISPQEQGGRELVNPLNMTLGEFNKKFLDSGEFYPSLCEDLKRAVKIASIKHKEWQKKSVEIYEDKFAEEIWRKKTAEIFYQ